MALRRFSRASLRLVLACTRELAAEGEGSGLSYGAPCRRRLGFLASSPRLHGRSSGS